MIEPYEFPPLVSAYLTDARVRNAVDTLTGRTMTKGFDSDFEWSDYPVYVDGWLAAQQTVAEWNKAQFAIWDRVWGTAFDGEVIYDAGSTTADVFTRSGIAECWQDNWYGRHVKIGTGVYNLCVVWNNDSLFIEIEFVKAVPKKTFDTLKPTGWQRNDDELDGPEVHIKKEGRTAFLPLVELQAHAREAVEALAALD